MSGIIGQSTTTPSANFMCARRHPLQWYDARAVLRLGCHPLARHPGRVPRTAACGARQTRPGPGGAPVASDAGIVLAPFSTFVCTVLFLTRSSNGVRMRDVSGRHGEGALLVGLENLAQS